MDPLENVFGQFDEMFEAAEPATAPKVEDIRLPLRYHGDEVFVGDNVFVTFHAQDEIARKEGEFLIEECKLHPKEPEKYGYVVKLRPLRTVPTIGRPRIHEREETLCERYTRGDGWIREFRVHKQ